MELKPIMEFATEHQKTISMVFVFILLVSALNLVSLVVSSRKTKSLNPSSTIPIISNSLLAIASTLLLALCVLFLDTSKTLYDSFDGLVSGVLLPITIVIDIIGGIGILVLAFVVLHYRKKA
ncbi:hypothetical protein HMPREF0380_00465 [Eubacterium infirmum F0142]|nr:hypothetical protein HMPREF0380_00465 [Eubacterium infirmum F0142]